MTPTPSRWGRLFRLSFQDTKKRMAIAMCQNITSFQQTQAGDQWQTRQSYQTDFLSAYTSHPTPPPTKPKDERGGYGYKLTSFYCINHLSF